jgi:hypothetical protein
VIYLGNNWIIISHCGDTEGISSSPQISFKGNNVYVVRDTYTTSCPTDIFFTASNDNGHTFSTINLSNNTGTSSSPQISSSTISETISFFSIYYIFFILFIQLFSNVVEILLLKQYFFISLFIQYLKISLLQYSLQ